MLQKIGQSTHTDDYVLTWDNDNTKAIWAAVGTISGEAGSVAADNIGTGDAQVALATSSGAVYIYSTDNINWHNIYIDSYTGVVNFQGDSSTYIFFCA